jgi:hypothetical protein
MVARFHIFLLNLGHRLGRRHKKEMGTVHRWIGRIRVNPIERDFVFLDFGRGLPRDCEDGR